MRNVLFLKQFFFIAIGFQSKNVLIFLCERPKKCRSNDSRGVKYQIFYKFLPKKTTFRYLCIIALKVKLV